MGYLAHVVAMEEISRASASVGLSYGAHSNLCVNQIRRNGTPSAKARYLPKLISRRACRRARHERARRRLRCRRHATRAEKKGDRYVLNGNKMWITNGADADVLVVYAKTDPTAGARGITRLPHRERHEGVRAGAEARQARHARLADLRAGVRRLRSSGGECARAPSNDGVKVLMSGLDYERAVLAGGPLGIMQACLDVVLPYVHERKQFGQAIGEFQLMQGKIADMYTALEREPRLCLCRGAGLRSRRDHAARMPPARSSTPPRRRRRWRCEAIQALGGNGYINEFPTGRLLRDAKLYEIGAGTSEIRRMLIGRELFDETRDVMSTPIKYERSTATPKAFAPMPQAMRGLVDDLQDEARDHRARRRRGGAPAPHGARQAAGARAHRGADRSRRAVSRAVGARRAWHVWRRGAGGRHRHRHRPIVGRECMIVANDATVKGGTYYPAHGEEASARAGNRAAESPALHLSRRFRRRASCRTRTRSFPIASISGASSTIRRRCRRRAFRRSRW